MTDFISATLGNDIVEAGVTVAEEQEIVARSVGDSDDDSLGLTDLENSIREVAEMEERFLYKVVCSQGAVVRSGVELQSPQVCTKDCGTIVESLERRFNDLGLARIRIATGWISEILNPLSGLSGRIIEPIAMSTPLRYKVVFGGGCVVRRDVETASPIVTTVPCGEYVDVIDRKWTDHPSNHCQRRFKLRDGSGWVSTYQNVNGIEGDAVQTLALVGPSPPMPVDEAGDGGSTSSSRSTPSPGPLDYNGEEKICPDTVKIAQEVSNNKDNNDKDSMTAEDKERLMCIICMDEYKTAMLVHGEIGHIVTCISCARILYARGDGCPICRLPISSIVQYGFS